MVQMSFTLPLPHDKRAEGAALQLAHQDGHGPGDGRARQGDGPGLHLLRRLRPGAPPGRRVARSTWSSASSRCCPPRRSTPPIKRGLRRPLVVVGACIGTDAHTVGIDAILNIKGFAGEKGLEYYREITVVNLGAQVLVPDLVERARAAKADAVLVSQVVTQRTRTCTTPGRCPRRSARRTRPASARCSSSAARGSTSGRPPSSASTASSARARRPARWRSYLVHALVRRHRPGEAS